ncbi:RNA polymerase sigma-70 factor [Pedobacter nyackensis]|uniref:RNA polymerase sigma factor n=1 Tax=Pedobacter nyackensis TaxID=475255 RepID=UPI00292CE6D0|nr:RNA polymerase sigma-70 factor [Pedobacter nyackensis]
MKRLLCEKDLLTKVSVGDQNAFKMICDYYYHKIFTFSVRILHSDLLAEEVVQETMLKLWLLGGDLTKISNLDGYLKKIARNKSIDLLRQKELKYKIDNELGKEWDEGHNETEEQILLNDTRKILEDGIALLPEQQKLVYQLCHQEGLKYGEVAEQMNLSPLTVQSYMKLALRFLRNYVSKHTDILVLLIIFRLFGK